MSANLGSRTLAKFRACVYITRTIRAEEAGEPSQPAQDEQAPDAALPKGEIRDLLVPHV